MKLETFGARLVRYTTSFAAIAALHWSAVAWAMRGPPINDEESQTGGVFMIELSAITASPNDQQRDISVGVKSEEIAAVAPTTPQQASLATLKPLVEDSPVVEAKISPEDAVQKRPEERPDEIKTQEAAATPVKEAPAVAAVNESQAAAPQQIENATEVSETARGEFEGLSHIDRQAVENWRRDLVLFLGRSKRYPAQARQAREFGVVNVAFAIDRAGRVLKSAISSTSGHEILDKAAMDLVKSAGDLPPPPATIPGDMIELIVPVNYRWRDAD